MATVTFDKATRLFPGAERPAVDALDIEIGDGEFLVLVGPSGCGKSTSLRMLAGLEDVNGGSIRIGDRDVTNLAPKDRDIAMVFQNYALYPHMTVGENMGFALKIAGEPKEKIRERVAEAAKILDLEQYVDRKPKALSGGQRQRVAMGRAIVRSPQVFLMDEPLSNLDAKLRVQTRSQIAALQRRLGVTTVYVTHDQVEAMTMGDRVAVLKDGILQQVDTPRNMYDNPVNTDSLRWTTRPGVVHARYAPAYATPLLRLEHQSALFRRGDSSLVVLAYDLRSDSVLARATDVRAALVLTRGDEHDATIVRAPNKSRGVITAHSVWAPLLMSAEVTSPTVQRSARARYGIRPPYAVGARVSLSDLLLFEPYGQLPASLDEVIPHAMPTLRVRPDRKVGFYWEAYGTNPAGEVMNISVVVAPEVTDEPTRAQRLKRALRVWKEAKPVSIQVQDVSARGQTTSARAVEVDISTLPPGPYLVELEIEVAQQYHIRAERRIVVVE